MNVATTAGAVACATVIVVGSAGPAAAASVPAQVATMKSILADETIANETIANDTIEVRWGIHATQHHASQLAKNRSHTGHHHRRAGQK